MLWPPSFLDPIENLWGILKKKLYEGGQQVTSTQQLCEAILASSKEIQEETADGLTSSMDETVILADIKEGLLC